MTEFEEIASKVAKLVAEKQEAYGDSFGKCGDVLKLMYPNGITVDQYTDALCIVRILDKLFRIATHKKAFGESPYDDIIGYGILGAKKDTMIEFPYRCVQKYNGGTVIITTDSTPKKKI